ncbi:MAG: putative minor head protein [Prokaryotic dsDNA virus sp.]|nr:MAG: putative minor head protein [Prokaryotic dsDNA virus sp.]|tara:strand:+ start:3731 stop:4690 length:960 start_codon:yes stop_codon:yes gene_type:complete
MQLSILYQEEAQLELDRAEATLGNDAAALALFLTTTGGLRVDDPRAASRLEQARQQIFATRRGSFFDAFNRLAVRLKEVQDYERLFHSALLRAGGRSVNIPTTITGDVPVMGKTMDDWRQRLLSNDIHRLNEGLSLGARLGDNEQAMRARLIGHKSYGGRDGLTATTRRELGTLVRTATDAFADLARVQIAIENPLAGKEIYVAILDSRTTEQCSGLHGTVYSPDEGPRPPIHWYCRSTRVPLVGDGPNRIPCYREWLNRLSARDQDEILGPRQGASFRAGTLDLQNFREPNWRGIDLEALAKRESGVFEAAGMETPFQ